MSIIKIGVGGPVGSGKTALIERITRALDGEVSMAAITNDIYTTEDAKILARDVLARTRGLLHLHHRRGPGRKDSA